ncbi:MAG: tRNA (adenosine(37)-N6)-dimethylallyltransferase MiaA [Candidatus Coatesbacteria bacterium]|nr:tRNA (adenosine(37)-N6)-dimethylallyltransferase MiaA [Candidatus Coatesbacteria bacterium]
MTAPRPDGALQRTPIVVITGPTAVGKTRLALEVARQVPVEIISADSRQIYRGMGIGTGKPTPDQQSIAPHHLIDILDPDEVFSAADFAENAILIIKGIHEKGALPLIVGGTFLYLKALLFGFFEAPPRSEEIRVRLKDEAQREGGEKLRERLMQLDPKTANAIHPNDHVRLVRALEICEMTGRTVSELKIEQPSPNKALFLPAIFALTMEADAFHKVVDARVDEMFANGFVSEVQELLDVGYGPSLNSFSSLGYRHVADFISGASSLGEAVRATKAQTCRYAKKQRLWLRQDWGFKFLSAHNAESNAREVVEQCEKLLQPGFA